MKPLPATPASSWLGELDVGHAGSDPLSWLETDALPVFLQKCRWFASKDKGTPRVHVARLLPLETGSERPVLLAILDVQRPDGAVDKYFLPLVLVPAAKSDVPKGSIIAEGELGGTPALLLDGAADDAFLRSLIALLAQRRCERSDHGGELRVRRTGSLAGIEERLLTAPLKRGSAEQSNTSVMVGDVAVLKLIRKLQVGVHPEPEIGAFLTDVARFPNTPALLAFVEHATAEGPILLALLQRFVPNEGDGWSAVLDRLAATLAEGGTSAPDERTLTIARLLGTRTAELHHAFATPTDDPAFAPEPVSPEIATAWAQSVRDMAGRALDALQGRLESLPQAARDLARDLLSRRDRLNAEIAALRPTGVEALRTRIHGDFHLGQVLVGPDDVFIVDFEGEPMRSMAERREKHSPLKDVAGMLRSIDYAAGAAARTEPGADSADILRSWSAEVSSVFLDAYRTAIAGCPSYPGERGQADALLKLFLLEKVFYEVGYELANRPDWLEIPLRGALSLLDSRKALPTA